MRVAASQGFGGLLLFGDAVPSNLVATLRHLPSLEPHHQGLAVMTDEEGGGVTRVPALVGSWPWAVLRTSALLPFRVAIARGVGDVMMSNATVPGLTALPASLSKAAVDALRAMGFSGTIMTDALSAGAIKALHLTPAQAALRAMIAGDDEVLGGKATSPSNGLSTATAMVNAIVAGVNNRSLSKATLESAATRVLSSVNPNFCPAAQR